MHRIQKNTPRLLLHTLHMFKRLIANRNLAEESLEDSENADAGCTLEGRTVIHALPLNKSNLRQRGSKGLTLSGQLPNSKTNKSSHVLCHNSLPFFVNFFQND
ncbi:hypothetical protein [Neobacillus dielmonensis]|nr:hypothetical protein [Neobacillus dielmonensis]